MDRQAMAEECLRIEKAGGNILAHLKQAGCISPWGTWHRLQIEELGRKEYQITDGKGRIAKEMRKQLMTDEVRAEAIRIALTGGDPAEYLKTVGFKNPRDTWAKLKHRLSVEDPETFAEIPAKREPRTAGTAAQDEPQEASAVPDGENSHDGSGSGRSGQNGPENEGRITKPLCYMGFAVTGVESEDMGRFYYDKKHGLIDWESPDQLDSVSLSVDLIRKLLRGVPDVLRILGVDPDA